MRPDCTRRGGGGPTMYMLEGVYIDVSYTDILETYGSVAAYLRDGLGLTDEELELLKDVAPVGPDEAP